MTSTQTGTHPQSTMSALQLALGAAFALLCMPLIQAQQYGTQDINWKWRQGRGTYFGTGNWSIHHGAPTFSDEPPVSCALGRCHGLHGPALCAWDALILKREPARVFLQVH